MWEQLLELVRVLAPLSLVAVGGGNSVLPDIHRQALAHGWLTDAEFSDLYALAQTVPGPNLLWVSLVGWRVSGLAGALVAAAAMCLPSSVLAYCAARTWQRSRDAWWLRRLQAGLAPIALGLVLASGVLLARGADTSWPAAAATLATAMVLVRTRLHPLWLLGLGAALGLAHVI